MPSIHTKSIALNSDLSAVRESQRDQKGARACVFYFHLCKGTDRSVKSELATSAGRRHSLLCILDFLISCFYYF